jgi:4-hydroxy-3-methylbut-2-enyl diphosphate reductase IspH
VKVTIARPTGFCFGVERAIRQARAGQKRHGRIHTLGELVHNPLVLEELENERNWRTMESGRCVPRSRRGAARW